MSTKRINFATINSTALEAFSAYNVAYWELRSLRETYKAESAKIQAEKDKILENRKNDLDAELPLNEVLVKWSTVDVERKQAKLDAQYESDCEPHKDAQKKAMGLLDVNLYYGYVLSQKKGSFESKGSITIKKGKSTEEIELDKSYKAMIKDFLETIGCSKTDDEKALNKFVNTMAVRTSGMIKCNKGDDYVKVKSASQYNNLFMLNFLQYLVNERGLLVAADDQTLSLKEF